MKKKLMSSLLSVVMILNMVIMIPFTVTAERNVESDYSEELKTLTKQYLMYATGENALQLNASNVRIDGNLYTGDSLDAYSGRVDVYGKAEVTGHINKHQYTIFNSLQYTGGLPYETYVMDEETGEVETVIEFTSGSESREYEHFTQAVVDSLGSNYATYQWWYGVHNTEVSNDSSIYVRNGGLQLTGNTVTLQDTIIADNSLLISASTALNTADDEEVNLYVPNGNIGIYVGSADINGIIYAPNGTVQICGTDININGAIIAKEIMISAQNVTINENYNLSLSKYLMTGEVVIDPNQDSDCDDLKDYDEVFTYGTDPFISDTDGDGLPDGYEVLILGTQPLIVDTDGNGIGDDAEDFDKDGLTNLQEYLLGTDPWNSDTDGDGLWDGDEVNNRGTDPIKTDTDNDGLWDGEEGYDGTIYTKYGLYFDPLNPDTNDNGILDGDESFLQSISKTVDTHDGAVIGISVEMETSGNLGRNLSINSQMGIDMMSSDIVGLIGDPFDFKITTDFNSATVKFTLDTAKLGNTKFNDLIVLWYDEENQQFVECNNENGFSFTRNAGNSTLAITTSHFSQYMVVDSKKWYQAWDDSFQRIKENAPSSSTSQELSYNTIFVIDTSGSMTDDPEGRWLGYDPIVSIDGYNECRRITACENFIDLMLPGDKSAIVTFSVSPIVQIGLTDSKTNLKSALQNINDVGGTHFSSAINAAIDLFSQADLESDATVNRIIFLSDGVPEDAGDTQSLINAAANRAHQNGIRVYTFGLGKESGDDLLKDIADITGGEFHKVINASDLTRAFGIITIVNPDFSNLPDADGDGLPDLVELYGLRPNGQPIDTDPNNPDTDGDGINDGIEVIFNLSAFKAAFSNLTDKFSKAITMKSDPVNNDSDGDGLLDNLELNRWGWSIKDPEPFVKNDFIPFGTDEYFNELEDRVNEWHDVVINDSYYDEYHLNPPPIENTYTDTMMGDVNYAEYYDLIPFEYWNTFCDFFNDKIIAVNTQELHYFRNKLNRAPETLDELINESEKWALLAPKGAQYHMFDTEACFDKSEGKYKGEYNLKFVSKDGKFEAVYNYAGILLDENNDPVNMGTYNYASPNDDPLSHLYLDVKPYSNEGYLTALYPMYGGGNGWFNVLGVKVDCDARKDNMDRYEKNTKAKQRWKDYKGQMS